MAVYTVQISSAGSPDVVSLTDGSTYATLEVSAGRGPKGAGWTGVTYSTETGRFTFTSNDGIGYVSDDITVGLDAAVTDAEAAQAAAEAAQAATESLFDQFGDQYLGPKASDPTVDNDGDPLTEGDIYFNTTDDVLKFYSGTAWVAPESVATTAAAAAQAAQTAAETAEANAETAEVNAATSEANAATSETNAAASASAAATSETNAATSETNAAASESTVAASASAAATSEANAAASETAAAASESAAATSETNAASSASSASTSASNAATSESNAASSASAASTSATNAATSASAASTSETNAASSASSAATSASEAAASAASINPDSIDINGGTIDGTVIGGSTPAAGTFTALTSTDGLTVDNDAATVLTVDRATSDGTIIDVQKDGTSVGSIGNRSENLKVSSPRNIEFNADTSDANRTIYFDGDQFGPFLADDASVDFGMSNRRWKDLYLSGGVYLGGTGSANKLDDYEEGTWTPVVAVGTVGSSATKYTKIGNLVTIYATLTTFSDTTTNGDIVFTGLPFTVAETAAIGTCMFRNVTSGNGGDNATLYANVAGGSSFVIYTSAGNNSVYDIIQYNYLGASSAFLLTATYRTNS